MPSALVICMTAWQQQAMAFHSVWHSADSQVPLTIFSFFTF
jgi:hypothetical protein